MLAGAAEVPFDAGVHPAAPDYALAKSWAARGTGSTDRRVDVFYVQPTTFASAAWNQDVADKTANAVTDASVTTRQLTAFATCCALYQPRYRQASTSAFGAMKGDGGKAYDLAYQDIERAFQVFLKDTHGRPFILAGHSQGALHVLRLLKEKIAGTPLQKRLIVTYVPGIGVPLGLFGTVLPGMSLCQRTTQTGCVVRWNSYLPGADVTAYPARSTEQYDGPASGKALLCSNPVAAGAGTPSGVVKGECDGGVLRVTPAAGAAPLVPLPGGSLHMYDIP